MKNRLNNDANTLTKLVQHFNADALIFVFFIQNSGSRLYIIYGVLSMLKMMFPFNSS